jgi:hypothetical protein
MVNTIYSHSEISTQETAGMYLDGQWYIHTFVMVSTWKTAGIYRVYTKGWCGFKS